MEAARAVHRHHVGRLAAEVQDASAPAITVADVSDAKSGQASA